MMTVLMSSISQAQPPFPFLFSRIQMLIVSIVIQKQKLIKELPPIPKAQSQAVHRKAGSPSPEASTSKSLSTAPSCSRLFPLPPSIVPCYPHIDPIIDSHLAYIQAFQEELSCINFQCHLLSKTADFCKQRIAMVKLEYKKVGVREVAFSWLSWGFALCWLPPSSCFLYLYCIIVPVLHAPFDLFSFAHLPKIK